MSDGLAIPEATIRDCGDVALPRLGVVEQVWETDPIPLDEVASAADAVAKPDLGGVPDGGEVAVGAGSRGIAHLPAIVSGVVDGVRDLGYQPLVFPAMGSHGGATAEGQRDDLRVVAEPTAVEFDADGDFVAPSPD